MLLNANQKDLLNLEQAAARLSVTTRHVRQHWQSRQLAGVRVGRLVRFAEVDLDAYIARQRVEAITQPVAPTKSTRPLKVRPK